MAMQAPRLRALGATHDHLCILETDMSPLRHTEAPDAPISILGL